MARVFGLAVLAALVAGGAQAQPVLTFPGRPFDAHQAARLDQQRLADQLQVQALTAAQARLQAQQTLQALELARPPAVVAPQNYPASSGVRRPAKKRPRERAPLPTAPAGEPAAVTRAPGDLPL